MREQSFNQQTGRLISISLDKMNFIYSKDNKDKVMIEASLKELMLIYAALNEICNGIDLFEFETRVGASTEDADQLLNALGEVLDKIGS